MNGTTTSEDLTLVPRPWWWAAYDREESHVRL